MTFEQYHTLMDKYGIEVDADLYLCYRNYLLGRIETDTTYEDPNRNVAFITYDNNGKFISGDPLILICTYSATDDGYNPARYVKQLFKSLESLVGSSYTAKGATTATDLKITENIVQY